MCICRLPTLQSLTHFLKEQTVQMGTDFSGIATFHCFGGSCFKTKVVHALEIGGKGEKCVPCKLGFQLYQDCEKGT